MVCVLPTKLYFGSIHRVFFGFYVDSDNINYFFLYMYHVCLSFSTTHSWMLKGSCRNICPKDHKMEKLGFAMIVDEIFTRLPAKAIGCLKCVCKDFCKELSTHFFEMRHSCRIGNSHKKYLSLRASLNGLLLVTFNARCCELILWNPTTRCHKLLSVSDFSQRYVQKCDTGGMYFDETNDLKVLHIKYYLLNNVVTTRVYSRRCETWREIDFLRGVNFGGQGYSMSSGIYSGKSIYFVCSRSWYPGPFERKNSEHCKEAPFYCC
ncbi:putative F-box-like domain superfamily protein [Helianthus annuus]|nr:putative F-box-like domain superfamily protein [Helianthus annuus]